MGDVSKAIRENFQPLVLALRVDLIGLPANERRLKITESLARIETEVNLIEELLK